MTGLVGGYPLGHFINIPRACEHCRRIEGHAAGCVMSLEPRLRHLADRPRGQQ